jgi:hypothetical protein
MRARLMTGGSKGGRRGRQAPGVWRTARALALAAAGLALVLGSGCAVAPKARTATTPSARPTPSKPDRDTLLTDLAHCHMLRVSQSRDARATDTAVVAALERYRVTPEELAARANALLPAARAQGQGFAKTGEQACARIVGYTGVQSHLARPKAGEHTSGVWVRYDGEILPGLADKLAARLRQEGAVGLIVNSPGGNVYEARKLGRYLRASGLKVAVDKVCASACIDVLAGGVSRYITRGARIGIHQSSAPSNLGNHNTGQSYVAGSALYLREMGIDPDVALAAASVPPNKMYWISANEAIRTRLATALIRSL